MIILLVGLERKFLVGLIMKSKKVKTKTCRNSKCKMEYPVTEEYFYKNKDNKDGFFNVCKECCKRRRRKYHKEYREEDNERSLKWCQKHKDKKKKYDEKYYQEHREKKRERSVEYYYKHKNERREYKKNKWKTDIGYRTRSNLNRRLNYALKSQNIRKTTHTMCLIGCSINFLKKHFESQFLPGMAWDNYGYGGGKWCVDHIKPCVAFDLIDPEQQKECFNYKNLQPLWNKDNLSKSSFYNGKYIRKKSQ